MTGSAIGLRIRSLEGQFDLSLLLLAEFLCYLVNGLLDSVDLLREDILEFLFDAFDRALDLSELKAKLDLTDTGCQQRERGQEEKASY